MANVDAREGQLRVVLRQLARFGENIVDWTRPTDPTRKTGGAEAALPVASVLDLEPSPSPGHPALEKDRCGLVPLARRAPHLELGKNGSPRHLVE
jgi:hypothetical protein